MKCTKCMTNLTNLPQTLFTFELKNVRPLQPASLRWVPETQKNSKKKGERNRLKFYLIYRYSAHTVCPFCCHRNTLHSALVRCAIHILPFSGLHIFPIFTEIPLAQSRSLIKTTINGKSLQFPQNEKEERINSGSYIERWRLHNKSFMEFRSWPIRDNGQTCYWFRSLFLSIHTPEMVSENVSVLRTCYRDPFRASF